MNAMKREAYNKAESCETWQVKIRNVGVGAAIINRCEFEFETSSTKNNYSPIAFDEVVKELTKSDLVYERDYWLENITAGFTLSPNEDYTVFEAKIEHIQKIKHLDMHLYFQGFLGDKYYRKVFFMPRKLTSTPKQEE